MNTTKMAEVIPICRLLLCLTICWLNIRCTIQQSCSGPAAGVGNRCRFDGVEICCAGQATCGAISGYCECPAGKTGPTCEQVCPLNARNNACESTCAHNNCIQDSRCRQQTSQLCICNPQFEGHNCESCIIGFKGTYCDIACPVASDGVSCENDCSRNHCSHYKTCTQTELGCQCKIGAKGPNCEITCPISGTQSCEISCMDNYCHTASSCRETATGCQCLPGHYGEFCSSTCLNPGWTGLDCSIACPLASDLQTQTCESVCINNPCHTTGTCQQTTAGCHCLPGYSGKHCQLCSPREVDGACEQYCKSNGFPCESGSFCDISSRQCDCPDGLTGDTCQFCDDSYSIGCSQFCESGCYGGNQVCNTRTGMCECSMGFTGSDCRTCDPATHPIQCTDTCSGGCGKNILCNIDTRQCMCKEGLSGSSCEYCHPTQDSGQCREFCEYNGYACDASSSCLTTTGECLCPNGQSGSTCQYCTPNTHNHYCKHFCPSGCYGIYQVCNIRTSQCECLADYTGSDCNMCDPSSHPSQCFNFCSQVCSVGTFCDTVTRRCTCRDGYLGDQCNLCRPSLNSQRCTQHCSYACEKGDCYLPTGECLCVSGFSGPDCSLCDPQEEKNNCRSYCDVECLNGGHCDVYDGTCYCTNSFYSGKDCSLCNKTLEDGQCLAQCGDCLNGGLCNTSSLACECQPGYTLGDCSWCTPQEESNRCLQHCEFECLNLGHCDTINKNCICQDNYTGSDCGLCIPLLHRQKCVNYCGVECKNSATCDTRSGSCICPPGFNGSDCSEICVECRVPICDLATGQCENVTQVPTYSMASSGNTKDPQKVTSVDSQTLLIGVGSAVGVILLIIIILLIVSVWRKGNKEERSATVPVASEHIPMMDGHENSRQQKYDNSYSQANTLMSNRTLSVGHEEEYDAVCDNSPIPSDSDGMYAYASTEKMRSLGGDSSTINDDDSVTYAYATPDQAIPLYMRENNAHHGSHNTIPVEVNAQYNNLQVSSSPSAVTGSNPNTKLGGRGRGNTYEDPADLLPPGIPVHAGRGIPPYAQVNKGKKGPALSLTDNNTAGNSDTGPMSPRYTVVEPDFSASDSEDAMQTDSQSGGTCPVYAEASDSATSSIYEEANDSPSKARMPPYAKVNKNKKAAAKNKSNGNREIYDKLQRPLTTFTIEDDDGPEDQGGEYSHLIANPQVKKGYSKLDYGSPPSNSSKPQIASNNTYAELQVQPENR